MSTSSNMNSATSAGQVAVNPISGIVSTDVQGALAELKIAMNNLTSGYKQRYSVDGGGASSIVITTQILDGGGANG